MSGGGRAVRLAVLVLVIVCVVAVAPVFAYSSTASSTIQLRSYETGSAKATCPAGTRVLFGGVRAQLSWNNQTGGTVEATGMHRTPDGKWTVEGEGFGQLPGRLTAIAYCGRGPVRTKATTSKEIVGAGSVTVRCPAGKVVLAGGFLGQTGPSHIHIETAFERVAADRLRISVDASAGSTAFTGIAYCGDGPAPQVVEKTMSVPPSNGGTVRATCPSGTTLTFGGWHVDYTKPGARMLPFRAEADSSTVWSIAVHNIGDAAGNVTALAYCR